MVERNGHLKAVPDPIDEAVEKVANTVEMASAQMMLPSGRPMVIGLPKDFTDVEALQAIQQLLIFCDRLRAQFPPNAGLVVARNLPNGG